MDRRTFLACLGGATSVSVTGCLGRGEAPQEPEYDDWFDNVPHFDGFEDRTESEEITVEVGAGEHGFLFDPPAVTVLPGTEVVFEWTGRGGEHEVEEVTDFGWSNPEGLLDEAGHEWRREFTEPGTHLYECWPHVAQGMKGAIFVDATR